MDMLIETLYEETTGEWKQLRDVCVIQSHGWNDPKDYVKEARRRFPHRDPKPFRNGLEMRGDAGTLQRVWFEEPTYTEPADWMIEKAKP